MTAMWGIPFISSSSGSETRRSTSSAAWPGHCVMISTERRRKIGIGVHRHPLERDDSPDGDEPGQHQHEEALPQCRLDDSMDHSEAVTYHS